MSCLLINTTCHEEQKEIGTHLCLNCTQTSYHHQFPPPPYLINSPQQVPCHHKTQTKILTIDNTPTPLHEKHHNQLLFSSSIAPSQQRHSTQIHLNYSTHSVAAPFHPSLRASNDDSATKLLICRLYSSSKGQKSSAFVGNCSSAENAMFKRCYTTLQITSSLYAFCANTKYRY